MSSLDYHTLGDEPTFEVRMQNVGSTSGLSATCSPLLYSMFEFR